MKLEQIWIFRDVEKGNYFVGCIEGYPTGANVTHEKAFVVSEHSDLPTAIQAAKAYAIEQLGMTEDEISEERTDANWFAGNSVRYISVDQNDNTSDNHVFDTPEEAANEARLSWNQMSHCDQERSHCYSAMVRWNNLDLDCLYDDYKDGYATKIDWSACWQQADYAGDYDSERDC